MSSPFNADERDIEVSAFCNISSDAFDTIAPDDIISVKLREQTHNMQAEILQFEIEPNEVVVTIQTNDTTYLKRYKKYKTLDAFCRCNNADFHICNGYSIYRKHTDKRTGTLTLTAYSSLYKVLNSKVDDVAVMEGDNVYNLLNRVFTKCGIASDKVIMSQSVFSTYSIPHSYQSSYSVAQILNQICSAFCINIYNDRDNNVVVRPFAYAAANADNEDYTDSNQICDIVNSTDITDIVSSVEIGYTALKSRSNSCVLSVRNCEFNAGDGTTDTYKFDVPYVAKISYVRVKNKNVAITGITKCTQSKVQLSYHNKATSTIKADMDIYSTALIGNEREWKYKTSGKGRELEIAGNDYIQSKGQIEKYLAPHYKALIAAGNEYLYEIETMGSLSIKPNMAISIVSEEFDEEINGKIVAMENEMAENWIRGRIWVYTSDLYSGGGS